MISSTATTQGQSLSTASCWVSVVIKALNEEQRICATLESALQAVADVGGEVILADSYSSDRTVELASRYPVRIVQLLHSDERCCGVGPQLGFQHSQGEFVYIVDGDMEIKPGFLQYALAFMLQKPEVAGVAGRVVEHNTSSMEYIARNENKTIEQSPTRVDRLDGGGLYRRQHIDAVGYLSDRNLHSYEELDLALRLRSQGFELWRLPVDAVSHYGHDAPPYELLMRRWRSGYICGLGELLRAAASQPSRFRLALGSLHELRLYLAVIAWWALILSLYFWPLPASGRAAVATTFFLLPLLIMVVRKRSFVRALYALVSWNFHAAGLLRGLLRRQRPANEAIASQIIKEPSSGAGEERAFDQQPAARFSSTLMGSAAQKANHQSRLTESWQADLRHSRKFDVE